MYIEDGIVKVRLAGACIGCSMSSMTISMNIEENIKEAVPEIKKVVTV